MINSVRNTVLAVLNKNNYGYVSPADFNLYAKQAQIEIFKDYFSAYNKVINQENARVSGTDYADEAKRIEEVIESFIKVSTLSQVTPASNKYFAPSLTTTGSDYYMINKILCYESVGPNRVLLGEAEKVSHGKITMLTNSILTSPTKQYPAYTQESNTITVYPSSINLTSSLDATYIRYPKDPKWTYITLANGEPVFDQSQPDFQDFEIPVEDEFALVLRVLQYCGMSIREIQAVQFGAAEEQKSSNQ